MKQREKTAPFEHYLNAYITNVDLYSDTLLDQEAEFAFSSPVNIQMPQEMANRLLNVLKEGIIKDSLGTLIKREIVNAKIAELDICSATGLSEKTLKAVAEDSTFTNSIPVRSLAKLLKLLNITIDKVIPAIEQTFEKLSLENKLSQVIPTSIQPSFRKETKWGEFTSDLVNQRSDERYLYKNKEALEKYTNRLEELYQQI